MRFQPGSRLGPYEITAAIGAGGMGEVYQATDTNLRRKVAIKVLPDSLSGDVERLARFQREAEVLAALNHPNIAQIYGVERASGTIGLVMELVEGPTLADRIEQGAIGADEALPIANQISDALAAAHDQGIVHRDLKPDGSQYKHGSFGLSHAVSRPGVRLHRTRPNPTLRGEWGHVKAEFVRDAELKSKPVEAIMQPAFPFVDVSTPVELLSTMISHENPAVLVRDFKTDKTFIITRSDIIRVLM